MFTRYDYRAGSSAVNVIADIVALLTGTTDKATLSIDCVQATTVIINDGITRPAGWTVFDSAAGTRAVAIRALNYDESTYKYVVVNHNNTTGLFLKVYESWNSSTHIGTNLAYQSDTLSSTVNLALGGTLFISSSARFITTLGVISGVYDTSPIIVAEHSRDEPWDTVTLNIPPYGHIGSGFWGGSGNTGSTNGYAKPRIRSAGLDVTAASAVFAGTIPYSGSSSSNLLGMSPQTKVRDAGYNSVHAFCPITVCSTFVGTETVMGGKLFDMFLTTKSYGTSGDEVVFNGNTYFIMAAGGNGVRLAIPKY